MTATIENELQQLAADLPALKSREETAAQALQRARAAVEDLTTGGRAATYPVA